jgi:hypothetical protein
VYFREGCQNGKRIGIYLVDLGLSVLGIAFIILGKQQLTVMYSVAVFLT